MLTVAIRFASVLDNRPARAASCGLIATRAIGVVRLERAGRNLPAVVVAGLALALTGAVIASEEAKSTAQGVEASSDKTVQTAGPQDMRPPEAAEPEDTAPKQAPGVKLVDEDTLRQRIQARWQAAIAGDFAKVYGFETPAYRETTSQSDYASRLARSQARWHVATLKELRYDRATQCDAVIALEFSFALPGSDQLARTTTEVVEPWEFDQGQWWRKQPQKPLGGGIPPKSSPLE